MRLQMVSLSIIVMTALSVFTVTRSVHSDDDDDDERLYRITIQNLTGGQPLTPPVIATHERGVRIFRVGGEATAEVQAIAENGNNIPLLNTLARRASEDDDDDDDSDGDSDGDSDSVR